MEADGQKVIRNLKESECLQIFKMLNKLILCSTFEKEPRNEQASRDLRQDTCPGTPVPTLGTGTQNLELRQKMSGTGTANFTAGHGIPTFERRICFVTEIPYL